MRTNSLAMQTLSAVAANVACTVVAEVAPEGKGCIGQQQRIAHIVEG